ncbi:MAG: threonine synthase [Dehalococcoidia bacterium]|nr:threonine synthase [Dehalococcoidia bacterium]
MGVLQRYRAFLPVTERTPIITLGEGDTPLVPSRRIGPRVGCPQLFFKLELCNPTGSFKDRGMVVAVAKAVEEGKQAVLCASTGNTAASAAAYAAHCGLAAYVLIPAGLVARGKLAQAIAHGATIVAVEGNFDDALKLARELCHRHQVALVNSINPHRLEGQKTAAFEIVDALGEAPDMLFIPVGNAGNISAYWQGFVEYHRAGHSRRLPRMMGFQAEGAAPIVRGEPVPNPQTVATAIRVGNPASWHLAIKARDESGGAIEAVSDDEILEAYRLLAQEEGIFAEPSSAAALAGLLKVARRQDLRHQVVVCVITGSGLKDPEAAETIPTRVLEVPPRVEALEEALRLP